MDMEWFESGEYQVDVEKIRTSIMRDAIAAKSEAQTAAAFQNQLYYYIRLRTGIELDFNAETTIKEGLVHDFGILKKRKSGKGRMDAVVNNVVIEYKKQGRLEKKKDQKLAVNQVIDYLQALYVNEGVKYNAVLTDGIRVCYFGFKGENIEHTALKAIEAGDIDRIIKALITNERKQFVAENILKDFSVDIYTDSVSRSLATKLYAMLCDAPTDKTNMLFMEWESLMHLSCDDNGKGNDIAKRRKDLSLILRDDIRDNDKEYKALFSLQTSYAIIVKLIACKVMNKLEFGSSAQTYSDLTNISSSELQKFLAQLEDGYVYRSSNIINLLEGDFFSWYAAEEQWDADLWKLILDIIQCIDEYSAFSFDISYEPVDIFKDLYMSIMPKSVRHSMGEYYTPEWLADYVISQGLKLQKCKEWKAIDPCCGSGTFIISLIKHIVGDVDLYTISDEEKKKIMTRILNSVYGIDINPLSVLSARVGYYLALLPFGNIRDIEIPIYLGDSAITPAKVMVDNIECYTYSVANSKKAFDVVLPVRFVKLPEFGKIMMTLQTAVRTDDANILYTVICDKLTKKEKKSKELCAALREMSDTLIELHKNNWDGIWVRIVTNYMMIARLGEFHLIVGNPPWVKWEHLPSKYAEKIKKLCNVKHIFSTHGRFGGTQLNICALISNVAASNWLKEDGVLAFLMPDSIMSQNSYEEFRHFYLDYENSECLYLQKIDKWEKPLRPFSCEEKVVSQDFNTYYYARKKKNYKKGIQVTTITRKPKTSDIGINRCTTFKEAKPNLVFGKKIAAQLSERTSAFSYLSDEHDFLQIVGPSAYEYRTGVEFTPQELYMLVGKGESGQDGYYRFGNKKFQRSKYIVDDAPAGGWDLPVEYIYPLATGPMITPFHCEKKEEYCIVPYKRGKTKKPIGVSEMVRGKNGDLFQYLLNHQSLIDSQSEKSKEMHRGDEFYALSKIGPYTFSKNIVAARDNTKFCASVIKRQKTAWGERKPTICVKHTMVISRDVDGREITSDEAHYICGILNSDIVIEYMQNTFKSNGYSLKKSHFYLPLYDKENERHKEIVSLSKKAARLKDAKKISDIQSAISDIYIEICNERDK